MDNKRRRALRSLYNDYTREYESQAHRLFIEYYSAHLPGVPCDEEQRHETQLATNKHWIEWVDDGGADEDAPRTLVGVSDKMKGKGKQPFTCLEKDQSFHLF